MTDTVVQHKEQGTFLGHPKGLFVLFFTEMWERFNYYGMRALLMLYMVNFFKWNQEDASKVYKWFTGLCYLTPLIGGFLADKYLGNKWAIVLGACTMAVGQFCMSVPEEKVFYFALALLVIGNGLFKPNMATQVGRLYPPNDARRDSAYTIFYMGINLGAFISPILCDILRLRIGYHAGFIAAGVGMLLGCVTYLMFIRWVQEAPPGAQPVLAKAKPGQDPAKAASSQYLSEAEANRSPSLMPGLVHVSPTIMAGLGVAAIAIATVLGFMKQLNWDDAGAYGLGIGVACFLASYVLGHIRGAARDRVLVIFILGVFVIFFWGAFEQAGNAMNIFADKTTNRYLTEPLPVSDPFGGSAEAPSAATTSSGGAWSTFVQWWNPVPTAWFQSINALAIFVLAPLFAWMWVALPRRGINLSVPAKMGIGIFIQGMAFALMIWTIRYEGQPSSTALASLPSGCAIDAKGRVVFRDAPSLGTEKWEDAMKPLESTSEHGEVVNGGRIKFDAATKQVNMKGVLADTDRDRIVRATVPTSYLGVVRELALASQQAKKEKGDTFSVSVKLDPPPPGFELRYSGFSEKQVRYDSTAKSLIATTELADRDHKSLMLAGADPAFRDAMFKLYVDSAKFKVSSQWLLWFYIMCTLGELCLSPVGLSMVSKLAPKAHATMMMGAWHVMIFFGNYTAGKLGESYGTLDPTSYFLALAAALTVVSLICFAAVKAIRSLMHGVN